MSTASSAAALSPLTADMRVQDPDRFLSTLFASSDRREALFALYAFDHEIAKVRRVVREPMAGLIRLQWWRDALDGIEVGDVRDHPVVRGLSEATRRGLDRGFLDTAIDARERELEEERPGSVDAFEQHLSATNGGVAQAAVTMLGSDDPEILAAAGRLGVALGLLERLRWLDTERGDRPLWLPETLLAEQGLIVEPDAGGGEARQAKVKAVREALANRSRACLATARKKNGVIPRHVLPAFFPGTLAEVRLRHLNRPQDHPAVAAAPYRLLWHWLRKRF